MTIAAIRPLSFIDYPRKLSAVIFFQGCNFKCSYCHNFWLLNKNNKLLPIEEFYSFLEKRIAKLDGVVLSGGEPTIWNNLVTIAKEIKSMGFSIKLDTNGYNPKIISKLLELNLLDYIAMDIKGPLKKYSEITNKKINTNIIKQSIEIITQSKIEYEFRTTLIRSLLSKNDIIECGNLINGAKKYCLQKFNPDTILDKKLKKGKPYSCNDFKDIKEKLSSFVKQCEIRFE